MLKFFVICSIIFCVYDVIFAKKKNTKKPCFIIIKSHNIQIPNRAPIRIFAVVSFVRYRGKDVNRENSVFQFFLISN